MSLEALEQQKQKEKILFSQAVSTLNHLHELENAEVRKDNAKIIEKLHEQLASLTEIRESYNERIIKLKDLASGKEEDLAIKDQ